MEQYTITFLPEYKTVTAQSGETLLQVQIRAGLHPDAPCGGKGTCGKCTVLVDGQQVLACQTMVDRDMTVTLPETGENRILTGGLATQCQPDGANRYALAFDIGTTTVVCYLLDGISGCLLAQASTMNPQAQFGADVISRIQEVLTTHTDALKISIRKTLAELCGQVCSQAGIAPADVGTAAVVGNTAMHHLLLGIDPSPLVTPPYMPGVFEALELEDRELLPIGGSVRLLPNIAGFVGGDTVGCMAALRFDRLEELSLLIDIGTNGEMVLGDKNRRIACSTAAGPAFEGAKISCGMRGAAGAVDHVWLEDGQVRWHVIGEDTAVGLCGSGLLDLVAVLLELGIVDESGRLEEKVYKLGDTEVTLTQKDIREVQLAKAAIRAGIELLSEQLGTTLEQIQKVYLAGAFGNYLDPASACRIGMIPPVLEERIHPIGNAAGEGSKLSALSGEEFEYARHLAGGTEFLELASLPEFQDCFVDALEFEEDA
ncbi:MAG: DUF4445 domain-containing protein [Oscillospiraceae bacterium]|nr:DUF4445 domain-containing protein [Oscillospiraceae bacterium]